MPFPKRLLADHEELVLDIRPHWIALVGPVIATLLLVAIEVILFARFDPSAGVGWVEVGLGVLVFLIYPVRAFLAWITSHFVITTDRVIHRSGWLAKRSMEMPLERINDVRFQQTVLERVVGAGDLIIESGGEYGQNHFRDIRDPEGVQKLIYERAEENEARMRQGSAAPAPDPAPQAVPTDPNPQDAPTDPVGSPLDEIERLASMKQRGVITEEEFETQKRRLLGRL
ncbi:MAG: PH domain-containing protein [Actinomycetota bacterium]|nr:PH domain-containing protein [Actinomycetota bacterium]